MTNHSNRTESPELLDVINYINRSNEHELAHVNIKAAVASAASVIAISAISCDADLRQIPGKIIMSVDKSLVNEASATTIEASSTFNPGFEPFNMDEMSVGPASCTIDELGNTKVEHDFTLTQFPIAGAPDHNTRVTVEQYVVLSNGTYIFPAQPATPEPIVDFLQRIMPNNPETGQPFTHEELGIYLTTTQRLTHEVIPEASTSNLEGAYVAVQINITADHPDGYAISQTEGPAATPCKSIEEQDPDTDGDGVKDSVDACPTVPGTLPNGCNPVVEPPKLDSDGDGILDENDACPTVAGNGPDGCPTPETPVVPPVTTTPVVPPNLPAVPKVCNIPGVGLQLVTPATAKRNSVFTTRVAMRNIGTASINGEGAAANTKVVVKGAKLIGSKAQLKKQGIVAKGNTITIDVPNKGIAPGKALAKVLKLRALKGKQVSIDARANRGGNALYSFQDCEMPAKRIPATDVESVKVKLKR